MTPKEKAHQIYDNMYNVESHDFHNMKEEDAVQCAIIAVDEVLNVLFDYGTKEINDNWEEDEQELLILKKHHLMKNLDTFTIVQH
jgi:hypothetical protein